MSKRNEPLVLVRDPNGEEFEVSHRNASDLVLHRGWTYVFSKVSPEDALATQPRDKKPRDAKLIESRKIAEAEKAAKASATVQPDKEKEKAPKKAGKPKASKKPAPSAVVDEIDESDVKPFDEDVDTDLADLEAEEADRVAGNE